MRLWEIIEPLYEMAFRRRAIIDKLRSLQPQIISHALKIIVYSTSNDVPHWKTELTAWGDDLAEMYLRTIRGARPMGFEMAWYSLYREPFEGHDVQTLVFKLNRLQREYQRPITKDEMQVWTELTAFLRSFCEAIGRGETVHPIVAAFGTN